MSNSLTWIDSSFISPMVFLRLFLNEMKPWFTNRDWLLIAAQFFTINRLCFKRLLFSAISNSTAFTFSCSPSSSSWRFDWYRSRRVTTSLENVIPTRSRAHNSSTSLLLSRTMWRESWQLGSGTASQVKHQKLRNQIQSIRNGWWNYYNETVWMNKSPRSSVIEQLQNAKCKVARG